MIRQLLIGGSVSAVNIVIHALVTVFVVRVVRSYGSSGVIGSYRYLSVVMVLTAFILMAAHLLEIFTWGIAYIVVAAAPSEADEIYFAFVNYTTLGYGDVLPTPRWRILGPMTAMNGILMFGWSTALIFEVLRTIVQRARTPADDGRPNA